MEKQIAREHFTFPRLEKRFPREHFTFARQQKRFPREHLTQPPQPGGARSRKFSLYAAAGKQLSPFCYYPRQFNAGIGPTGLAVPACSFFGSLTGLRRLFQGLA